VILTVLRTHSREYASLEECAAEKGELLAAVRRGGFGVVNGDDVRLRPMAASATVPVVLFGAESHNDVRAESVAARWPERLTLRAVSAEGEFELKTQMVGAHWLPTVLGAWTAALRLGVDPARAAGALRDAPPFPGRMFPVLAPSGAVLLRDDYNASIDILDASLRVLSEADAARRILVITDFADFRGDARRRARYLATQLAGSVEAVVVIGESAEKRARHIVKAGLEAEQVRAFTTLEEADAFLRGSLGKGDLVLLKGRTTDHAARLALSHFGPVTCSKRHCPKLMLCDICWEVGPSLEPFAAIEPLRAADQ